jgi:hypothetical protein
MPHRARGLLLGFAMLSSPAMSVEKPSVAEPWLTPGFVEYFQRTCDMLIDSSNPRDWALAAGIFHGCGNSADDTAQLLARAGSAAPNDSLVQWIVVERAERSSDLHGEAMRAVQRIEPANAAVWNDSLVSAAMRRDAAGVDEALDRMAQSTDFNDHLPDVYQALVGVFKRQPPSNAVFLALDDDEKPATIDGLPSYLASHMSMALPLPAMQYNVNACRVSGPTHPARSEKCASAGRTMAAHSDTLLASMIGYAMLRASRTFTDADVAAARRDEWVYEQWSGFSQNSREPDVVAFHRDWLESQSELEAMRRQLTRHGIAGQPPVDWKENNPRFSPARLAQDDEYLSSNTIDY